jgi:serine/threonine protein phosphatase PrpC
MTSDNKIKTNQDSFIAIKNFTKRLDHHIFAILDGHGLNGHFVSNLVKKVLPMIIEKNIK